MTHVAMESTGNIGSLSTTYSKKAIAKLWSLTRTTKQVPGRKTDVKDAAC